MFSLLRKLLMVIGLCTGMTPVHALSISGILASDDGIAWIPFTVTQQSTVSIFTTSYAAGGFDPLLSLFSSSKDLIALSTDDPTLPPDSNNGFSLDDSLLLMLAADSYLLAVTQFNNAPFGPTSDDGFNFSGQPCDPFSDVTCQGRTGDWTVVMTGLETNSSVPEPGTFSLLLFGFGLIAFLAKRRSAT